MLWCCSREINPLDVSEIQILDYLTNLSDRGCSYSVINTHKSAVIQTLLACGNNLVFNNMLISRFMKGIFNKNPPKPKYTCMWDVSVVLRYLTTLYPLENLPLDKLSWKVASLLALCTAQRSQTLVMLDLDSMNDNGNSISFDINSLTKTCRPGSQFQSVVLECFNNHKLCIVRTIRKYIERTKKHRKSRKLIVSYKTFKQISTSTLAHWLKIVLKNSNINTNVFQAHSYRGASTSAAYDAGVSVQKILKTANWSNSQTFHKFYYRKSDTTETQSFSNAVLSV